MSPKILTETAIVPFSTDVYVALRLGEMSKKPTDVVLEKYKRNKGKGWGAIAKSLGIKPGSSEFHELKRSQDLYNEVDSTSKCTR